MSLKSFNTLWKNNSFNIITSMYVSMLTSQPIQSSCANFVIFWGIITNDFYSNWKANDRYDEEELSVCFK